MKLFLKKKAADRPCYIDGFAPALKGHLLWNCCIVANKLSRWSLWRLVFQSPQSQSGFTSKKCFRSFRIQENRGDANTYVSVVILRIANLWTWFALSFRRKEFALLGKNEECGDSQTVQSYFHERSECSVEPRGESLFSQSRLTSSVSTEKQTQIVTMFKCIPDTSTKTDISTTGVAYFSSVSSIGLRTPQRKTATCAGIRSRCFRQWVN